MNFYTTYKTCEFLMSCQSIYRTKQVSVFVICTAEINNKLRFTNQSMNLKDYMLHAIVQAALSRINDFHTECCTKHSLLLSIFFLMDMAWFRKATFTINRRWRLRNIYYLDTSTVHSLLFTIRPTTAQLYQTQYCGRACPVTPLTRTLRLHVQPLHKSFITLHNQHFIDIYHFIF